MAKKANKRKEKEREKEMYLLPWFWEGSYLQNKMEGMLQNSIVKNAVAN